MSEYVIVGDVGGTKVRFALARKTNSGIEIDHIEIFRNADFADFRRLSLLIWARLTYPWNKACSRWPALSTNRAQ